MKIVTDSGADLSFEECQKIDVTMLPLKVEIGGKSYQAGVDIDSNDFYDMMDTTLSLPKTSTPSIGDFQQAYEKLAKEDPEILSIHISSGLSGTMDTARQAAELVENAQITLFDTLSLSAAQAWYVEAAVKLRDAGKSMDEILLKLNQIQSAVTTHFTLPDLKFLIAGGRISHLKGLMAVLLGIKPVIEVSKEDGKYYDKLKKRSFSKAILGIVELLEEKHQQGEKLLAQICTAGNPDGGKQLVEAMNKVFDVEWLPEFTLGTALGAHTGRGLVGIICAEKSALPDIP